MSDFSMEDAGFGPPRTSVPASRDGRLPRWAAVAVDRARHLLAHPALRFLLAGGFAAAVNWLARFPFSLVLSFAAAIVAAQVVGWAVGFVLYRAFVFAPSGRSLRQEVSMFLAVNAASLAGVVLVALALARLLAALGFATFTAEAVAHGLGIAAGAVLNFLGHRAFTFAASSKPAVAARP